MKGGGGRPTPDPEVFREIIYSYYESHGRILPWRLTRDPYHIFVSEIMLQQTQVERVAAKYEAFIDLFPDFYALAAAPLDMVLRAWQGLGYNRRALALKKAASVIVGDYSGALPASIEALAGLPGIGAATAASIAAFAFDVPVAFIETNVRTVFIHFFFQGREAVSDREIMPAVEQTLDREDPRTWYYALMDYGTMLKKEGQKAHRRSTGYRRQSPFRGSLRQVRGAVVRLLSEGPPLTRSALAAATGAPGERIEQALADLEKEGFIRESEGTYTIA